MSIGVLLAVTAAVTLVSVALTYAVALRRDRFDTIDTFWGLGFALVAVVAFALSEPDSVAGAVTASLTVVWGVRLGVHLHTRNRGKGEDERYVDMARRNPGWRMFVRVYLTQGVILWFVSLPVQVAQYGQGFGPLAWLGVAVWAVGLFFEAVGDAQLRRFKADPANRGRVLDTGLWRYTRHPNYFGDACVWWGLYLLACTTWLGAATVLSPVVMTVLLARGTGKPLLEGRLRRTRPEYASYVERTSGFVPLPPRRPRTPT